MLAYYNEFSPEKAAWLRELIKRGLIAPGEVDERSIEDVQPNDLMGFTQCHFFAGIGAWSYALRLAGWPDDRPIWTASCPCQPFSAAGKGDGFDDERHVWPALDWLISQCSPHKVVGEQVASKDGLNWLDLVLTDLEAKGYTCGAVDTCAAGFGAPHIRQRMYWVADTKLPERRPVDVDRKNGRDWKNFGRQEAHCEPGACSEVLRMANACCSTSERHSGGLSGEKEKISGAGKQYGGFSDGHQHGCPTGRVADDQINGRGEQCQDVTGSGKRSGEKMLEQRPGSSCIQYDPGPAGPTNGQWRDADWILCRDRKWRPVRPGTFPLANGAPGRVVRLRGYGDAIVAEQAKAFIEAVM